MIRHVSIKKEHDSQMPSLFEWKTRCFFIALFISHFYSKSCTYSTYSWFVMAHRSRHHWLFDGRLPKILSVVVGYDSKDGY